MGLSNLKDKKKISSSGCLSTLCAVRRIPVALTQEEGVRQALLSHLFQHGGYPASCTWVEVPIHFFVGKEKAPKRRLDIVCFQKRDDSLEPLLLVECKACVPSKKAVVQLLGYNYFVKAPFVALSWPSSIVIYKNGTLFYEGEMQKMPLYTQLQKK